VTLRKIKFAYMHKCRGHQDGRTGAGLSLRDVAKLHSFLHTKNTFKGTVSQN